MCKNFATILSHGKLSEKAPDTVPFGRENNERHVPAYPTHMCETVYLANPALHMGLELHGDLTVSDVAKSLLTLFRWRKQ